MMSCIKTIAQQPEQDCTNAIPVTIGTYYQPNAYTGTGAVPNEINNLNSCLGSGELNDVWYQFTTMSAGNLGFVIMPNNTSDDYDWAVYNISSQPCSAIYNTPSLEVSCNFSGTAGATGPNGNSTLTSQNASGTPFNAMLSVLPGETYVINVSNYSSTQNGYTITFSDSNSVITSVILPLKAIDKVKITPNPISDQAWIDLPPVNEELELIIYNSTGQEVRRYNNIRSKIHFCRGDLPEGVYICRLQGNKGFSARGKLVLASK